MDRTVLFYDGGDGFILGLFLLKQNILTKAYSMMKRFFSYSIGLRLSVFSM